ncbi:glycosyltransferase family 4 protein [bacterium]|nr:glycosyltransferase family 4 protein [candidate division CSSED10-310 bacterium]
MIDILFDARFITTRRSGVGRVAEMLLRTFLESNTGIRVHVMYKPPLDKTLLGDYPIPVRTPFDNHPWGDVHRNIFIRKLMIKRRINLFFSPAFYCLQMARAIPQVVLIHDMAVFDRPETIPPIFRSYLKWMIHSTIRNACRITTPSEFIRTRIVQRFPKVHDHVKAVHLGVAPVFRSYSDSKAESVRRDYCLAPRFILSVATVEPRKNLLKLLDAFAIYTNRAASPSQLVIVGDDGYRADEVHARAQKADLSTRVRFLGYIPDNELALLYGLAECMIFPSLYEGFGLPVLEAMAAGCPVITSNTASMPEVADGAAVLIDPCDISDMEQAMRSITSDAGLKRKLSLAGRARADTMSWRKTASEYETIFLEAAEICGREEGS